MKISVICPVYREIEHLPQVIDFFVHALPVEKELIFVDGGSGPETLDILNRASSTYPNIRWIKNPNRYVPFALNLAIQEAQGEYICRIDAHTQYPLDYIEKCLNVIQETKADNVGGYISTKGKSDKGKAIAQAMSTIFGVGNTEFRTRILDDYVDSVPFGFWHRCAFDKYGLFDVELIRNQDDEFNYRINKKGGKVFQSSSIHSYYFIREDFVKLFQQYYQYGLYKPLVFYKLKFYGLRFRHIIPSLFILYLFTLPYACFNIYMAIPLAIYVCLSLFFSISSRHNLKVKMYTFFAYFIMHSGYGLGFVAGMFKWIFK